MMVRFDDASCVWWGTLVGTVGNCVMGIVIIQKTCWDQALEEIIESVK